MVYMVHIWVIYGEFMDNRWICLMYPMVTSQFANWKVAIEIVDELSIENGGSFRSHAKAYQRLIGSFSI